MKRCLLLGGVCYYVYLYIPRDLFSLFRGYRTALRLLWCGRTKNCFSLQHHSYARIAIYFSRRSYCYCYYCRRSVMATYRLRFMGTLVLFLVLYSHCLFVAMLFRLSLVVALDKLTALVCMSLSTDRITCLASSASSRRSRSRQVAAYLMFPSTPVIAIYVFGSPSSSSETNTHGRTDARTHARTHTHA